MKKLYLLLLMLIAGIGSTWADKDVTLSFSGRTASCAATAVTVSTDMDGVTASLTSFTQKGTEANLSNILTGTSTADRLDIGQTNGKGECKLTFKVSGLNGQTVKAIKLSYFYSNSAGTAQARGGSSGNNASTFSFSCTKAGSAFGTAIENETGVQTVTNSAPDINTHEFTTSEATAETADEMTFTLSVTNTGTVGTYFTITNVYLTLEEEEEDTYDVTITTTKGGTATFNGDNISANSSLTKYLTYGTTVTLEASAASCYKFDGWYNTTTSTIYATSNPFTFTLSSENYSSYSGLTAHFSLDESAYAELQSTASSLLEKAGVVGYPKTDADETKTLKEAKDAILSDDNVTALISAITAFKTCSNVVLPESGKAYRIKNVQNSGTKYILDNKSSALTVIASSATPDNDVFVFNELEDFTISSTTYGKKYAVVNELGKYLAYRCKSTTPTYGTTGYSDSYVADQTYWAIGKFPTTTYTGTITADDAFGKLFIGSYRSDLGTSKYGFLIVSSSGVFDTAGNTLPTNGTFYSDSYSSAFVLEEVTDYTTNQVTLKSPKTDDGKTYVSTYLPYAVAVPDGVTGYYCTLNGTNLKLNEIGDKIPANTGAILIGSAAATKTLLPATTEEASKNVSDNVLGGTTTAITASTLGKSYVYVLNGGQTAGIGFYPYSSTATIPAYKAYYASDTQPSAARNYFLFGDGETTGIESLIKNQTMTNGKFIENGRIVIVKNGVKYNAAGQVVK